MLSSLNVRTSFFSIPFPRPALNLFVCFITVVRLTVETGTITAAAAILDLVFFLSLHHNALHQLSGVTLSKLYTNSLLMLFNNRIQIRNAGPAEERSWAPSGSGSTDNSSRRRFFGTRSAPTEVISLEFQAGGFLNTYLGLHRVSDSADDVYLLSFRKDASEHGDGQF